LERASLENDLIRSQIAKNNQAGGNPAFPPAPGVRYLLDGQGGSPLVKDKPLERTPGAPGAMHTEPGAITSVGHALQPGGGYGPVPSENIKQRIEDNVIQEVLWAIKNNILPSFSPSAQSPPAFDPGPGKMWMWDPLLMEYKAIKKGKYFSSPWLNF